MKKIHKLLDRDCFWNRVIAHIQVWWIHIKYVARVATLELSIWKPKKERSKEYIEIFPKDKKIPEKIDPSLKAAKTVSSNSDSKVKRVYKSKKVEQEKK